MARMKQSVPLKGKNSRKAGQRPNNGGGGKGRAQVPAGHQAVLRRQRRAKPGSKAVRDIKKYQRSGDLLIPKAPFQRLVREVLLEQGGLDDYRIQGSALEALQAASEAFLVSLMEDSQLAAIHAKRVTVQNVDLRLVSGIRGRNDPVLDTYRQSPWAAPPAATKAPSTTTGSDGITVHDLTAAASSSSA